MIIIKGLYTAKLSPKVTINVPLRIRMGMLKIVMLVVDMVPWTATMSTNRMVLNQQLIIMIGMIIRRMIVYIIVMWVVELV